MPVDYNNISHKFSESRKNMKWDEIHYFIDFIQSLNKKNPEILDIGCGNWRLLWELQAQNIIKSSKNYTGIDASSGMVDEALKIYSKENFLVCDMWNLEMLWNKKYDYIFFIASFHHLENLEQRLDTLQKAVTMLSDWWYIFMTNWSLESEINKEKYKSSYSENSRNTDWGADFFIKLWEYKRFYHSFSILELETLFKKIGLKIVENKEFENKRNFISILQK